MQPDAYNEGMYADERIAREWIDWIESISNETRDKEIYPYLSAWVAKHHPKKILEIGSGQGICSHMIDLGNAEYIGVEPSAYLRDRAHVLYPDKKFIAGMAEALPLEALSVDAAFSVFVWLHIDDLEKAARELARVLAPGGVFVIATANPEAYDLWLKWHTNIKIEGKKLVGDMAKLSHHIMILHSIEELKKSLTDQGLTITEVIECGYEDDRKIGNGFALIISGKK